jgi:signal transduction histidine kinase
MNHRSLAFRLGLWYTLLLSATFVLVGAAMYFGLQHYLRSSLRDSLSRRSEQVERILQESPADTVSSAVAREIETRVAPEFNNRFVRVTRLPETLVYRSNPPADRSFDPSAVRPIARSTSGSAADPVIELDLEQHLMIRATTVGTGSGTFLVELGISVAPIEAALDRLLDLLAVLLPVLIACAAAGGYWLVNRALRPVDRLSRTAEHMSLQNLGQRLPVVHSGDALERLSMSFNTMLGRLRDSLQTSRRFLADASHELRTPLTVIKGELEELTRESRLTEAELRERVGSVLEEVARLEHLVSGC